MAKQGRLRRFMTENTLTEPGLASLLAERLDDPDIDEEKVMNVIKRGDSRVPKAWEQALELPPGPSRRRADETPPEAGADAPKAKPEVPDELDWRSAKEAIVSIYVTIGQGVAQIRRKPEIAAVFKQGAPVLADDWIRLARVDARVRGVIAKLMIVGPGGQLAMDHLILVGKLVTLEEGKSGGNGAATLPRPEQLVDFADGAGGAVGEPRAASQG